MIDIHNLNLLVSKKKKKKKPITRVEADVYYLTNFPRVLKY